MAAKEKLPAVLNQRQHRWRRQQRGRNRRAKEHRPRSVASCIPTLLGRISQDFSLYVLVKQGGKKPKNHWVNRREYEYVRICSRSNFHMSCMDHVSWQFTMVFLKMKTESSKVLRKIATKGDCFRGTEVTSHRSLL